MSTSPKITLVGAGGMSFGPAMVNDVVHTPELRGARLMLHDVNAERLQRAYQFAAKLNASAGAPVVLDSSTDAGEALVAAAFVLSSAEFDRFAYWKQDFEIPNRYGGRQINGENGSPGGVFPSVRRRTTPRRSASIPEGSSRQPQFRNPYQPRSRSPTASGIYPKDIPLGHVFA